MESPPRPGRLPTDMRHKGIEMALSDGDKAMVREIAVAVGNELMERFMNQLQYTIETHHLQCAAVQTVSRWRGQVKALVVGIAIGAAIVGSGGTIGALKLLKVF